MHFFFAEIPAEWNICLQRLLPALPFSCAADGVPVRVQRGGEGLSLARGACGWQLQCAGTAAFARALSLLGQFGGEAAGFHHAETPRLDTLGAMIDCSRGAVPTVPALRQLLSRLALMGYNTVQLYTEDTFTLPDEPYFGYLRGRYTQEELQALDAFAADIGIELVPCIQTLAHLLHPLKWRAYADVWDNADILLCGEEKTYALIDAMFRAMSEAFKSRRINIGMDEAHTLGLGRYLDAHGYQDRFGIMLRHLTRVVEIARKYGYEPMMWSDMFFRLANGGEYYASGRPIDPAVIAQVPPDVSLVYWDYYSDDPQTYDRMLKSHQEFGRRLVFAGGAWKWTGFTPQNAKSIELAQKAARACFANGVRDVLVTCWGDNGAEASMFSVLPALSCWAELCWATPAEAWRQARFAACCGAALDDFLLLDEPSYVPYNPQPGALGANPTKYLLYQDVLLGMADALALGAPAAQHFEHCAAALGAAAARNAQWAPLFCAQADLCAVLALKAPLGRALRAAYRRGDRDALRTLAAETMPALVARLETFQKSYHRQWLAENKPFGLDNFDIRTGGLRQRILTAQERVQAYLDGSEARLEELEQEILPFTPGRPGADPLCSVLWENICTNSSLFWM